MRSLRFVLVLCVLAALTLAVPPTGSAHRVSVKTARASIFGWFNGEHEYG